MSDNTDAAGVKLADFVPHFSVFLLIKKGVSCQSERFPQIA